MASSVLATLRSLEPSLTENERSIARTILERPDDVVEWSGRELARRSGTSETVLFKLTGKLGLTGFRQLKLELMRDDAVERARAEAGIFNVPFRPDAPLPVQIQAVVEAYGGNIEQTARLLAGQPLDAAAKALGEARLVTLLGMGASLSVATLAENVLGRIGVPCRLTQDSHQQLLQTSIPVPGQVVMAFSYSGETRETVEALRQAHEGGAFTIGVTAYAASPVAHASDIPLCVPVLNPRPYRVGLVDAVLPALMILDVLAILIGSHRDIAQLHQVTEATIRKRKIRTG